MAENNDIITEVDNEKPFVSICCTTYQHVNYIRDAIEGFLIQKTNFPIEIIIRDDASTDGTAEIVTEFALKYANLIRPIIEKENTYSKGIRPFPACLKQSRGKYIALCEGDDYWTDPLKLQKQVDFMENDKECSLVFSNAEVRLEAENSDSNNNTGLQELQKSRYYSSEEILNNWIIPTGSVLFRAKFLNDDYDKISHNENLQLFGDGPLFLHLASKGRAYGMKDRMVVYRRHHDGATNFSVSIDFCLKYFMFLKEICKVFGRGLSKQNVYKHMAKNALNLGLYHLKNKHINNGIYYIILSMRYNPKYLFKYLKQRF